MKVLAIDLSSATGSVAVASEGRVICTKSFPCERGRGAGVFAALEELRDNWRGAAVIAVGLGPGSYNGLRTACALANSMQLATGARLCSLPSVCLLPVSAAHYTVVGDARGGRTYCAEVRDRQLCGDISLISHSEAAAFTAEKRSHVYRIGAVPAADDLPESAPDAAILALLAPNLAPCKARVREPIYLKPPHITMPRAYRT